MCKVLGRVLLKVVNIVVDVNVDFTSEFTCASSVVNIDVNGDFRATYLELFNIFKLGALCLMNEPVTIFCGEEHKERWYKRKKFS